MLITQLVKKSPAFRKQEDSLLCSQELATVHILSQMNPFHIFAPYFPKIHSNIILPCTSRSSEWSLPFRFMLFGYSLHDKLRSAEAFQRSYQSL